jgi:transposase
MQVVYARCAGLDVHKKSVVACARLVAPDGQLTTHVRTVGTMTADLLALADWLLSLEITHVAMESTGEFWKPVFNILESQLTVLVVNAQHIKHVPGRKTDVRDAEWIADLLAHGLLRPSFVPPAPQRMLRDLTRQRTALVQERGSVVQRLQKVLEWANIKLSAVASDITGVSARAMLAAMLEGQTDPAVLARLAQGRLRSKQAELEQALRGRFQPHHTFMVRQHLEHVDFLDEQIAAFDAQIAEAMTTGGGAPPASGGGTAPNDGSAPGAAGAGPGGLAWEAARELVDAIPGIGQRVAEVLVAEVGTDMSRFPDAGHLASWARLCPGQHESGGKRHSRRIGQGNRYVRSVLMQAAHAAAKQQGTFLATFYQRLATRRGRKRAMVAVAHKILTIVYHLFATGSTYEERGARDMDPQQKERLANKLQRRIRELGYTVHLEPAAAVAA